MAISKPPLKVMMVLVLFVVTASAGAQVPAAKAPLPSAIQGKVLPKALPNPLPKTPIKPPTGQAPNVRPPSQSRLPTQTHSVPQRPSYPGQVTQSHTVMQPGVRPGVPRVVSGSGSVTHTHIVSPSRAGMGGINARPLPAGRMTSLPGGHQVIETPRGSRVEVRRNGTVEKVTLHDGRTATYHTDGQLGSVRAPGMRIDHGLRGDRTIATERNGQRVVSLGPHHGYLERPYLHRNGRAYIQRTYWNGGHAYARAYRDHFFHGAHYYEYSPGHYYHPRFYEYARHRWLGPVHYRWGWEREPWRVYYGPYFVVEPVYPSPIFWLTDYMLAADLQLAYQARLDGAPDGTSRPWDEHIPPPQADGPDTSELSPQVKGEIDEEVQRQIAEEQAEASPPPAANTPPPAIGADHPPAALDPAQRLFVVSSNLTVSTTDGKECELTAGDAITRLDDTPDENGMVRASVLASKTHDCGAGTLALVGPIDLQEMYNNFHEQLDSALDALASNQGKGGLPPAPDTATTPGEVPPPAPDGNIDTKLQDQQKEAAVAESQVQQQVMSEQPPATH